MARIPLRQPDDMNTGERAQYDRFPSNLSRTLLIANSRLAAALPNTANALRATELDAKWREGVILRVAALNDSAYERMQHLDQAKKEGWSTSQLAAIETGDSAALPTDFAAIMAFVDAIVAGPHVPDTTFDTVRSLLSDRDVVTMILLVGHYMTVARLLGILQVELDDKPDSWTSEH